MNRKWLLVAAIALALAGAALAGCEQQWNRPPEYPLVQPTQRELPDGAASAAPAQTDQPASTANAATPEAAPDGAATATQAQQTAPAGPATLVPAEAPEGSATAAEATDTLKPGAPAVQADTEQTAKEAIEKAKADLAKKLGISTSEITVAVVIGQEFSTDAFYCRTTKDRIARDESPAAISGFVILLQVSGRRYEYHASGPTVLFCRPLP